VAQERHQSWNDRRGFRDELPFVGVIYIIDLNCILPFVAVERQEFSAGTDCAYFVAELSRRRSGRKPEVFDQAPAIC
jgi:hypothetical protein